MVRWVSNTIAVTRAPKKPPQITKTRFQTVVSGICADIGYSKMTVLSGGSRALLSSDEEIFTGDTIPGVMNHFC